MKWWYETLSIVHITRCLWTLTVSVKMLDGSVWQFRICDRINSVHQVKYHCWMITTTTTKTKNNQWTQPTNRKKMSSYYLCWTPWENVWELPNLWILNFWLHLCECSFRLISSLSFSQVKWIRLVGWKLLICQWTQTCGPKLVIQIPAKS